MSTTSTVLKILKTLREEELSELKKIPLNISKINCSNNAAILLKNLKLESKLEKINQCIDLLEKNL